MCVLCEFAPTSEAQGCQATLQEEADSQPFTTTILSLAIIRNRASIEAFDCFSELLAGNYTISVREIECTGGIGPQQINHRHIRVGGLATGKGIHLCIDGLCY